MARKAVGGAEIETHRTTIQGGYMVWLVFGYDEGGRNPSGRVCFVREKEEDNFFLKKRKRNI